MPFREVSVTQAREILRLWLNGTAKKRIGRILGIDPKTVRRYVRAAERAGFHQEQGEGALTEDALVSILAGLRCGSSRPHGDSWMLCEEQRTEIEKLLDGGVRLTKIRKLFARRNVEIPYPTLHRLAVEQLHFGRAAPTIPVADCGPGQELQLDTGWMILLQPDLFGKRRRFRAWIFTSVLSRHRFVWPCFRETTASAIEACEAAWEFFGGIFRVLLPDNTKVIVQEADPLEPHIIEAFLEYAQARGFVIDPTRVRHPRDKGRVERSVPTVRDDCFGGECLQTIEDARRRARQWCLEEYGMRRHTRTQRLPLEHFQVEEKPALMPPPSSAYDIPTWSTPKVAHDQHAQVEKALYSLPRDLVGRRLRARADSVTVRFYKGALLVKTHPRKPPGGRSTDPSDFPPEKSATAMRDVAFFERQARAHGPSVGRFAHALLEGDLPWTRMRQVYKLLGLARRYGDQRLDSACATALEAGMVNVKRLERMLQLAQPAQSPSPAPKVIPLARYLRPSSQYRLPLAPSEPTKEGEDS